jgi:hypothetical protein
MLDREAEESAFMEPDSLASAMMSACHCDAAMKRMAAAHCGMPKESSPRESGKNQAAGSD